MSLPNAVMIYYNISYTDKNVSVIEKERYVL